MVSNWTKYESWHHIFTRAEEDRFFESLEANRSKIAANAFTIPPYSASASGTIFFPHATAEQAEEFKADKLFAYFGVLITYEDEAGKHYTERCEFFSGPILRFCSSHNIQR
jgi:hypothetical protein